MYKHHYIYTFYFCLATCVQVIETKVCEVQSHTWLQKGGLIRLSTVGIRTVEFPPAYSCHSYLVMGLHCKD